MRWFATLIRLHVICFVLTPLVENEDGVGRVEYDVYGEHKQAFDEEVKDEHIHKIDFQEHNEYLA